MNDHPRISVIMSTYNAEKYIDNCVSSILNQSFGDFELIIVDDCSTDGTYERLLSFEKKDERIVLERNNENQGLTVNLNKCIRKSSGEYIARMDSDDVAVAERFIEQISYMDVHKDIDICGTWAYRVNEEGRRDITLRPKVKDEQIKSRLICGNFIVHPSVMIRRKVFDDILYDETFRTVQDFKLWTDCWGLKFHNIPKILMYYRDNKSGISATERGKIEKRISTIRRVYVSLFEKLGISLDDKELDEYVKCVQNLTKFEDRNESEYAYRICRKVIRQYPEVDAKCLMTRWARGNSCFPKARYIPAFIWGYAVWYAEAFSMVVLR